MSLRLKNIVLLSVGSAAVAGCATVNPRWDYDCAVERATGASGYATTFRPGEEAESQRVVAELLADGLTADEAVQVALLNNAGLQAAFFDVGIARAEVVQAGLLSNPSLFMSFRLPAGGGLSNLEASLAQNVADLWQIPLRQQAAERSLEREILLLARRVAETALNSKAAYYETVGAAELRAIAEENLPLAAELLELATARQAIGTGTEVDVNLARAAMLEADLAVQAARLEEAEARRELAKLLGLTGDADALVLLDPLPSAAFAQPATEQLLSLAAEHRLDLQAARSVVAAAESALKLEWRRVFPTVELGLALERGERGAQPDRDILADTARASVAAGRLTAPEIEPRSARDVDTDFIIGPSLSLELPVFDQNQAQIARAAYAYEQAVRQRVALARAVVQDVRGAAGRLRTARRVAELYRDELLPLAGRNLELSRESYRAGKAPFLSVLEGQRFYLSTRSRAVAALRDFAKTLPALEAQIGVPLRKLRGSDSAGRRETPRTGEQVGDE